MKLRSRKSSCCSSRLGWLNLCNTAGWELWLTASRLTRCWPRGPHVTRPEWETAVTAATAVLCSALQSQPTAPGLANNWKALLALLPAECEPWRAATPPPPPPPPPSPGVRAASYTCWQSNISSHWKLGRAPGWGIMGWTGWMFYDRLWFIFSLGQQENLTGCTLLLWSDPGRGAGGGELPACSALSSAAQAGLLRLE